MDESTAKMGKPVVKMDKSTADLHDPVAEINDSIVEIDDFIVNGRRIQPEDQRGVHGEAQIHHLTLINRLLRGNNWSYMIERPNKTIKGVIAFKASSVGRGYQISLPLTISCMYVIDVFNFMKKLCSIVLLVFVTTTLFCQNSFELSYNIKSKLNRELTDSSNLVVQNWHLGLDSLPVNKLILAEGLFDSIVLIEYSQKELEPLILFWGNFFNTSKVEYENESFSLTKKQSQSIVDYLNNPNNYNWSECGSPIAEHELQFYKKGKLCLRLVISCDYSQVHLSEKNEIIKNGALNERGSNSTLFKLIEEIKN